jgi:PAS domain S-box-containing protein
VDWTLPWRLPEEQRRLVARRLRVGFVTGAGIFVGLAFVDGAFGDSSARHVAAIVELATAAVLGACAAGMSPKRSLGVLTMLGIVGGVLCVAAVAATATLAEVFPAHSYIAMLIGCATFVPWGSAGQGMAVMAVVALAGLNGWLVAPGALLPAREFIGLGGLVLSSVYVAQVLAEQYARRRAEARWLAAREGDRRRHLADLEARVDDRTRALAAANSALEAQVQQRERAQAMLELLMDSLPVYIAYVDLAGRFRWVNRQFEAFAERPRADLVGRSFRTIGGDAVRPVADRYRAHVLAGEPVTFQARVPTATSARDMEITAVPHRGTAGLVEGVFVLANDITDRRAAEVAHQRTERLAALGTLAAGIAHEVNNPAASILAAAELLSVLLAGPHEVDEVRETVGHIAAEAARCGAIVRDILQFAREPATPLAAHALGPIVERAAGLLRRDALAAGVSVRLDLDPSLPPIPMNPTEMLQVVLNLGANALGADCREVLLRTEGRPHAVALVVRDDGRGMTVEQSQRAFDPFFTTRRSRGGTGLGLSVTHAIVMHHGGRIDVRSRPGEGTTMVVELPRGAGGGVG